MKKTIVLLIIIVLTIISIIAVNVAVDINQKRIEESSIIVRSFCLDDYRDILERYPSDKVVNNVTNKKEMLEEIERIWIDSFVNTHNDYSNDIIDQKPYLVFYDEQNDCWLVYGTKPEAFYGWTAHIIVDNKSGKVLGLWDG